MGIVFDQSLNTTDSPSFVDVTVDTDGGIIGSDFLRFKNTSGSVFYVGANARIIHDSTGFYPNPDGFGSIGKDGRRFAGFYGIDGSFTGNLVSEVGGTQRLYNLGTEGDTDTEYLDVYWDTNKAYISVTETGAGIGRDLVLDSGSSVRIAYNGNERIFFSNTEVRPVIDNYTSLGTSARQFADVRSVDGNFSGTLSAVTVAGQTDNLTLQSNSGTSLISLAESGSISLTAFSSIYQQFTVDGVGYRQNCYPIFSTLDMGSAATPWDNGYFNNLSSAVGGSYKLYNLGTEGDTDTEFGTLEFNSNVFRVGTKTTGVGVARDVGIIRNGQYKLYFQSGITTTYSHFQPFADATYNSGGASNRWANTYSVDGSFSGNLVSEVGGTQRLYNLGTEGDADTEYLETIWAANNVKFRVQATGTGSDQRRIDFEGSAVRFIAAGIAIADISAGDLRLYSGRTIRPLTDNDASVGKTGQRFTNVYSYDGSFSGNLVSEVGGSYKLYNLGTEGDTDTEFLDLSANTNRFELCPKATGAGVVRELLFGSSTDTVTAKWHGTLSPYDSGSLLSMGGAMVEFAAKIGLRHVVTAETDSGGCLETTQRFSSGTPKQTWNQDGAHSFYGVLVADPCDVRFNITNDAAGNTNYERVRFNYSGTQAQLLSEAGGTGTQREFVIGASGGYQVVMGTAAQGSGLSYNGAKKFYWATQSFAPFGDNVYKLGGSRTVDRFSDIFSVNGSFGGTIFSEVGGSAKFYNLGVDGDTDTEYGEIKWDSNLFEISTEITGTGTPRNLRMSAGLSRVDLTNGGNVTVVRNNATYMIFGSANITVYRYLRPSSDLGVQFGAVDRRWSWGSFGGLTTHTQTITAASDTLGTSDHTVLCDCTLNSITINLPAAIDGQQYVIKKVDSSINTVTIDGDSSETIDGALTKTLTTQYECVTIVSDGANWFIVN